MQKWLNARPPARTIETLQSIVDDFDQYYNHERAHQGLNGQTPAEAWAATEIAPEPEPEPRMPPIPASARDTYRLTEDPAANAPATAAPTPSELPAVRTRTPLALHAATGETSLKVKQNGQVKVLSCLFYIAISRAGEQVRIIWDEQAVEIFTGDGEHLISYPRPETTGIYYGPRAAREGTPMKTAGGNPSAGVTGTARRVVSKGGYIGVLASKFYAGYKRAGEQVAASWDASTVTLTDPHGAVIATYAKPAARRGWHGPTEARPSAKS